jgi:hypothetical protein
MPFFDVWKRKFERNAVTFIELVKNFLNLILLIPGFR